MNHTIKQKLLWLCILMLITAAFVADAFLGSAS
jgi:hypothetical protein